MQYHRTIPACHVPSNDVVLVLSLRVLSFYCLPIPSLYHLTITHHSINQQWYNISIARYHYHNVNKPCHTTTVRHLPIPPHNTTAQYYGIILPMIPLPYHTHAIRQKPQSYSSQVTSDYRWHATPVPQPRATLIPWHNTMVQYHLIEPVDAATMAS